ncbi:MAG: SRPBCC family protein [Pseudomonadota bacterium]
MKSVLPHGAAALAALAFAYAVSLTPAATSGVQFVAPLAVVLAVHLAWLGAHGLEPGYAARVLGRGAVTGIWMAIVFFAAQMLAPMPSEASTGDNALAFLFCVFILIVVLAVIGGAIYLLFRLFAAIWRGIMRRDDDDDRLNDLGVLSLVFAGLALASLEGLSYRFDSAGEATARRFVDAPPEAVWSAMGQATSPSVALPTLLAGFPQPVAVPVDEGVTMGADRKVVISGREGRGVLHLKVVSRTTREVRFERVSHTSPMAGWIDIRALTYSLRPDGAGTRLDVTLEYDRLLAPAVFFDPLMEAASFLAMGVLAGDVAARAEG